MQGPHSNQDKAVLRYQGHSLSSYQVRTCAFSSARTTTAVRELLLRKTGVRPAMLPRLERLVETRADAEGTLMALDIAATCMVAAVLGALCSREDTGKDKGPILGVGNPTRLLGSFFAFTAADRQQHARPSSLWDQPDGFQPFEW